MTQAHEPGATGGAEGLKALLFVEDDPNDFLLAYRELRKMKLLNPVHHVANVEEMIAYMSAEGKFSDQKKFPLPEAVFLDMHMPKADGLDAAAWLRSKLRFRNVPLVAISGSGTEMLKMAVDMGAHALMLKPFDADEFAKIVATLKLRLAFRGE
ncbi:MAG: response regulator [Limisphaerales bacterium]